LKEEEMRFRLVNGKSRSASPHAPGIGLDNVRKRLTLLYPDAHQLRISEDEETFVVSLTLNLDRISIPA
jgi:LytS/YehU family sensor histidine kinase